PGRRARLHRRAETLPPAGRVSRQRPAEGGWQSNRAARPSSSLPLARYADSPSIGTLRPAELARTHRRPLKRLRADTGGAAGPFRVPLLLAGLALLAAFALLSALAASSSYFPLDVPLERWLQARLGGTVPWLFSAVSDLNGSRQTLVGILLLAMVIFVNPRTIVFA